MIEEIKAVNVAMVLAKLTVRKAQTMKASASAKGAQYESQGQAPNNVRRVAPGERNGPLKL
jgi:hypothetical protein